ncbi:interferon-induced transmembrane protein 1-like [Myxocyprinus asiaticus]|uniref:interferon-induced transmembrane protein 1-like n=1 Tax=Myxocyprinus asiaticus TaxID=70543 RepID=UPI0022235DFE|nr:interferon-induced transmembrane protein 1-like [Myxocyprinus asiaticus]
MDPSKSPAQWNSSEKPGISQPTPPPYQDPSAGYPAQGSYPMSSGYPSQPYGVPGGQPVAQGPYPGQPVVTVQPTVYVTNTPLANPLPDYLGYSIFTMLCCCLPLGIAALIYSISTRNANISGQQQIAEKNSKTARTLNHAALGIGLAFLVVYIIIIVIVNVTYYNRYSP